MRELLGLYAAGEIEPEHVRLGVLPEHAPQSWKLVGGDLELRFGLRLAEGVIEALPYARSEAVRLGAVRTCRGASKLLTRLEAEGVIRCVGEGPKFPGKGNGTKLFVPPSWRPVDEEAFAVAVELGDRDRLANLIWRPDQPGDAARVGAVQPDAEGAHELKVGGQHGAEGTPESGVWRWSS